MKPRAQSFCVLCLCCSCSLESGTPEPDAVPDATNDDSASMNGEVPTDDSTMLGVGGAGTASSGGSGAGVGVAASGGAAAAEPSVGCGATFAQPAEQWTEQEAIEVTGSKRRWWVWLPANYDPQRPYPLVVLLHGCGNENNNVPIQNHSGEQAIIVRGVTDQEDGCWTYGTEPNVLFFDAMVDATASRACIDERRIFAAGYSSGSWLISRLGCERADRLRAVATVAGGDVVWNDDSCSGNVAALFVHDLDDQDNQIGGSEAVRDRLLRQNSCDPDAEPVSVDPAPCVEYPGCDQGFPVVWCETSGAGHNRQDSFAAPTIWNFFSGFF